ncbi:protein kinase domain-containing protein [Glaciecola sp. 1036]|uniref:protein kinase domain-containing protein n=1 Tax=Alteromonadaceae TaxID=72275 RepID=UPI003D03B5C7
MSNSDKMLNKKIGRYELKEIIGEGAMAIVYRAYDPEINRSVACKILKSEHCVDEEYTSRFLREAKAAGSLSHASIVTVFDVGEIDGAPYIMMELIEGTDLGKLLEENHKITPERALTITLQLAKALDYAHSNNIVHRDIKPDNIMLLEDNETVKVADFGIARISENDEAHKTQVGSVLGTPRYMSPEQALGHELDGRSDLFSVGAILYEMLTGNKAFDAKNMGTLMMQISQQDPPTLKSIDPTIPVGIRQIVQKLLHKSPEKRFQTGANLAQSLIAELNALREQKEEQRQHKYIPLKYKFTLVAVAIVSLVLLISMNIIYNKQTQAMTQSAVDSGSSFAKFIAIETAIPLLSEDWITLETFINDAASRDTFSYLIVTDRDGIIRGASDIGLVDQVYIEDADATFISKSNEVHTTSSTLEDGSEVFNITTPILFQNTEVGRIIVGISQQGLEEVKSTTALLMFFLALITISAVAVIMFVFGGLISKPLRTITRNLKRLEEGDLDARISLNRSDEIGRVIIAFNKMASAIQTQYTRVSDELAKSGINIEQNEPSNPSPLEVSQGSCDVSEEVEDATIVSSSVIKTVESVETAPVDDENNSESKANTVEAPNDDADDQDEDATVIAYLSDNPDSSQDVSKGK